MSESEIISGAVRAVPWTPGSGVRPPFPDVIDSTSRSSFVSCPTKFYWEWIRRLTLAEKSPDLIAGAAFAHGLEVFRKKFYAEHLSLEDSHAAGLVALTESYGNYEPPEGHVKTWERMAGALDAYLKQYPPATDYIQPHIQDGKPSVEFSFAIPLDIPHPTTGMPLMYGGRFDLIGIYQDMLFVVDEKTTKQLGYTWLNQWDMRGQFMGYCLAAIMLGKLPVAGAIVRGISILKHDYGHAEVILPIQHWQLEKWFEQMKRDVRRMIVAWESGIWDQAFDSACASYSGCSMKRLCLSPEPEAWISNFYIRNEWNPLRANPEETNNGPTSIS